MADPVNIRIVGLRELNSAFRKIDKDLNKELQRGFKSLAERIVGKVQGKLPASLASAVRPRATQRGAGVAFPAGGATGKQDFYPWFDFGGTTGRGHVPGRGGGAIRRDPVKGGRFIYPTIAESSKDIEAAAEDVMESAAKRAGFRTS